MEKFNNCKANLKINFKKSIENRKKRKQSKNLSLQSEEKYEK